MLKSVRSSGMAYAGLALLGMISAFACALWLDAREGIRRHIAREANDTAWVVFLRNHADKGALEESIRALPGIQSIRFISKEEALETVIKNGKLTESITLTGRNPFPESFDVRWNPFFLRPDFLDHSTQKIKTIDGVDHVGYDRSRVDRLSVMQRTLYQMDLSLLSILWGGAFLLVLLVGKMLFFSRGALPNHTLGLSVAFGLLGGIAGVALAFGFVSTVFVRSAWAGAAIGLIAGLIRDAFQE